MPTGREYRGSGEGAGGVKEAGHSEDNVIAHLATFPRGRKSDDGSHPEEFRAALKEFNGSPFLDLRVYFRAQNGEFYPTKKGCSVRLNEAEDVAKALLEGLRIADEPGGGRTPQGRAAGRKHGLPREDGR